MSIPVISLSSVLLIHLQLHLVELKSLSQVVLMR